jgi:hypothetical protein
LTTPSTMRVMPSTVSPLSPFSNCSVIIVIFIDLSDILFPFLSISSHKKIIYPQ